MRKLNLAGLGLLISAAVVLLLSPAVGFILMKHVGLDTADAIVRWTVVGASMAALFGLAIGSVCFSAEYLERRRPRYIRRRF